MFGSCCPLKSSVTGSVVADCRCVYHQSPYCHTLASTRDLTLVPLRGFHCDAASNLAPTDQPPMFVNSARCQKLAEERGKIFPSSYLLERAIFSPTSVQTGVVSPILARSAWALSLAGWLCQALSEGVSAVLAWLCPPLIVCADACPCISCLIAWQSSRSS